MIWVPGDTHSRATTGVRLGVVVTTISWPVTASAASVVARTFTPIGRRHFGRKGLGAFPVAVKDHDFLDGPNLDDGRDLGASLDPGADQPQPGGVGPGQILGGHPSRRAGAVVGDMGAVQIGELQARVRVIQEDLGHHRQQAPGGVAGMDVDPLQPADMVPGRKISPYMARKSPWARVK